MNFIKKNLDFFFLLNNSLKIISKLSTLERRIVGPVHVNKNKDCITVDIFKLK